ncbi:Efflux RND transporter periplasmic adaptor subunit [Sulfidibacter corallicola]|uniref:Efflux RND transporter periplasmic adaptor subunit n=1 Tax=Sulfidibacter corallicola TaxID=2818388 RepID=A0A8A4TSC4_SULCO|nr:efflux RND transporter periplasmic adaptor subunit [Sulfidibacter corallicola]QTD52287.1 efflux RND transporter periplasmic adaptor subunit [Sulfidibacter corallicola]
MSLYKLLTSLALSCLLLNCSKPEEFTFDELPRPVITQVVRAGEPLDQRILTGTIQATEAVPLAFEVTGKIDRVTVNLGDAFAQGDLLAQLEQTNFDLTVKQRKGMLLEAKARLTRAESDFHRKSDLVKEQAVSRAAFEAAEAEFEAARQAVEVAAASLALAQQHFEDTLLLAPYDGVVTGRLIEPSQQVSAGAPALAIQNVAGLEVSVAVPENLLHRIQLGSRHKVRFPVQKKRGILAVITEIGERAQAKTTFPVTLLLDSQPEFLKPGMTAEVILELPPEKPGAPAGTFPIPLTALRADAQQGQQVFLFEPQPGRVSLRSVRVAALNGTQAYISQGLHDGDVVVVKGVHFLHDGMRARLVGSSPAWYPN